MISLIVAYDKNYGIGIKNSLPWKLSADLKNFKKITANNYIVMGRKTFESIGRALPNRKNIILTRNTSANYDGCIILNDIESVLNLASEKPHYEIFIIGGAEIYSLFIGHADRLYITEVGATLTADAYFPKWDQSEFKCIGKKHYEKDESNQYDFDFSVWEKSH